MLTAGQLGLGDPVAGVAVWGNPSTTTRDLTLARDGGFTWVRQRFEWRNIEPNAHGRYVWTEADRVINAIAASGLKAIVEVDNQPRWASTQTAFPASGPPDNPQDFADFLTVLAGRYKGRIQAYEVWHDPNLASTWGGRRPDPGEYSRLLRGAYTALKAADPAALVISAGLAATTRYDETSVPDLIYLRNMYGANAKDAFDVMGVDAPGFKAPPCVDPAQVVNDASVTNNDQTLPIEGRRVYAFRHVEDTRAIMADRGDGSKPIGVMAMGWTTDPRPASAAHWQAVSDQDQATYLVDAFKCAREQWSPWIGFLTVDLADPSWTERDDAYWFSITTPDGQPRPAYAALKRALTGS
jgi:hypothetical protein